jgi:hypothetical protein
MPELVAPDEGEPCAPGADIVDIYFLKLEDVYLPVYWQQYF